MLPRRYIEEWKAFTPWPEDAQVEQDLVIEKAMLELFSDPFSQRDVPVQCQDKVYLSLKQIINLASILLHLLYYFQKSFTAG